MSADLFAEFNELSSQPDRSHSSDSAPHSQSHSSWVSQGPVSWSPAHGAESSARSASVAGDDDDGWGDFEVAETSVPITSPVQNISRAPELRASKALEPKPGILRASTLDLVTNNLVDLDTAKAAEASSWSHNSPDTRSRQAEFRKKAILTQDPNVLFDAEDFELEEEEVDDDDEDEFGDYETVSNPRKGQLGLAGRVDTTHPVETSSGLDLLSLDDPLPKSAEASSSFVPDLLRGQSKSMNQLGFGTTSTQATSTRGSGLARASGPRAKGSTTASTASITQPSMAKTRQTHQAPSLDDDWAAWDDVPTTTYEAKPSEIVESSESWTWEGLDEPSVSVADISGQDVPPPVNVPPPSVILSAFPALLGSGHELFRSLSAQSASVKQQISSNPKIVEFLRGYLLIAATAGHVIAGRKQRWHRDKILAKSMSISSAGSKGMKLAGVDKTQSAREDRETAEVIAVWRQQVGRLRSAVAAANASNTTDLRVPELSENLTAQTAKVVPTAVKACIICGLKREERVTKVDVDIEDSFGEWWVDHWGHRSCKNFWLQHEERLRQR